MNSQYVSTNVAKTVAEIQDVYNISDMQLFKEFCKVSWQHTMKEPSRSVLSRIQSGDCRISKYNQRYFLEALMNLTMRLWTWSQLDTEEPTIAFRRKLVLSDSGDTEYKTTEEDFFDEMKASMDVTFDTKEKFLFVSPITIKDTIVCYKKSSLWKRLKKRLCRIWRYL